MADGNFPHPDARHSSIPGWPRLMRRETAAAYCDMSIEQFDRQCPVPAKNQGWRGHRWDRAMLDDWIENLPNISNGTGTESGALDERANSGPQSVQISAADRRRASIARA